MKKKTLSPAEVIHRALWQNIDDVKPLVEYLKMDTTLSDCNCNRETAEDIANYLRKMGSNDIATIFRGEGVPYSEVVYDVALKIGAKNISKSDPVEELEEKLLFKMFEDALDRMSDAEKRELFSSMDIKEGEIPYGATGTLIMQILLKQFGGFTVYRNSIIVANMVSRALLGRGLSFATNAALTRVVGTLIGPIGWIVTGAWLLIDIAGPAYRKTVPAIIHLAMLRQTVTKKVAIGIVGDGSAGKDSLMNAVFGIDTGNVNPVAGSTVSCKVYPLGSSGAVQLVNYPGFNDVRESVNAHTQDYLHHTDVFLMVVDITRGVSQTECDILTMLKSFGRPILVCLNKVDAPRPGDLPKLLQAAQDRLDNMDKVQTVFDPDPRLGGKYQGCSDVYAWVCRKLAEEGKETNHINKSIHVA